MTRSQRTAALYDYKDAMNPKLVRERRQRFEEQCKQEGSKREKATLKAWMFQ